MKRIRTKSPPLSTPRIGSLLHRLQRAPNPGDQPYLDQLMIFLDDPPPGTRNRWKQGAKMCSDWGLPCTGPSVWRLYRSYALEWRLRLAQEANVTLPESPESLEEKTAQLVALRNFELLSNPQSAPAALISLARIELRKKSLEFALQKHRDNQIRKLDLAIDELFKVVKKDPVARVQFDQLMDTLGADIPTEEPQP